MKEKKIKCPICKRDSHCTCPPNDSWFPNRLAELDFEATLRKIYIDTGEKVAAPQHRNAAKPLEREEES